MIPTVEYRPRVTFLDGQFQGQSASLLRSPVDLGDGSVVDCDWLAHHLRGQLVGVEITAIHSVCG